MNSNSSPQDWLASDGFAPVSRTKLVVTSAVLFLFLTWLYLCDGNLVLISDAWTSMLLAESALKEGNISLSEDEVPWMQRWVLQTDTGPKPIKIVYFDDALQELRKQGRLRPDREGEFFRDVVVPTSIPGVFANTFAPGSGISAIPFFAFAYAIHGDLRHDPGVFFTVGKVAAAVSVAGSAVLMLLIAVRFVPYYPSLLLTLAYALGTGVWSTSSQALWQHGPNEWFLLLGTLLTVGPNRTWKHAAFAGASFAAATWCRPTSALVVVCVAAYLLVVDRRRLLAFLAAGLPFAVAMLAYNQHYFGSPLSFGQTEITVVAEFKTGRREIWQTPLGVGLAGLLVSPSRGLFVFSPFLLFALPGMARIWRQQQFLSLRPFTIAVAMILCLEAKHFDWWGGWSYGYRHIVDTAPFWCLFLLPMLGDILRSRTLRLAFSLLLVWSFVVQATGAFLYDFGGWNDRLAYRVTIPGSSKPILTYRTDEVAIYQTRPDVQVDVVARNVDLPENQSRLWSLVDSQIVYYLTHVGESRASRQRATEAVYANVPRTLANTHTEIARLEFEHGQIGDAERFLALSQHYNPSNLAALELVAQIAIASKQWDRAEVALRSLLMQNPNSIRGRRLLGSVLAEQGKLDAARVELARARDLGDHSPEWQQEFERLQSKINATSP
ncbi:MAG: tetratricopeptide repeat protein [Planctomycetota bacterium]